MEVLWHKVADYSNLYIDFAGHHGDRKRFDIINVIMVQTSMSLISNPVKTIVCRMEYIWKSIPMVLQNVFFQSIVSRLTKSGE